MSIYEIDKLADYCHEFSNLMITRSYVTSKHQRGRNFAIYLEHKLEVLQTKDNNFDYKNYEYNLLNNKIKLYEIPKELRTQKICDIAFDANSFAYVDIPDDLKTLEITLYAIKKNGYFIWSVPDKLKTAEVCEFGVKEYGWNLQWVPENMRTEELCNLAILTYSEAEKWAPRGTSIGNNYLMKKALE